jgi:hypothetical protein
MKSSQIAVFSSKTAARPPDPFLGPGSPLLIFRSAEKPLKRPFEKNLGRIGTAWALARATRD